MKLVDPAAEQREDVAHCSQACWLCCCSNYTRNLDEDRSGSIPAEPAGESASRALKLGTIQLVSYSYLDPIELLRCY